MTEFTPARSEAIRRGLIDRAATELHQASDRDSVASTSDLTGANPSSGGHRGLAPLARWVAAGIALLLVGGVTAAAVTVTMYGGPRIAAGPTETGQTPDATLPASSDPDQILTCGGFPVPARALTDPRPASELSAEVQSVLENPLAGVEAPLSDWLIADESAENVVIMRKHDEPFDMGGGDIRTYELFAIAAADEHAIPLDPPWGVTAATSCTPIISLGALTEASVTLDSDAIPQTSDTQIDLLVTEHMCNSGRPATGRIELIRLVETETTVELVIGIRPNTGDSTCPSNPPTPFTVNLARPLGDRAILNAAVFPAGEIGLPAP